MRKLVIGILGTSMFLSFSAPASAQFVSGNQLYQLCDGTRSADLQYCLGYIAAISDQWNSGVNPRKERDGYFCLPNGVTLGQLKDVVMKHLRENPEIRDIPANYLASIALGVAFPCRIEQ